MYPSLSNYEVYLRPVVIKFVQGLSEREHLLENAFREKDWISVKALAHKLKGAAGSYGFQEIRKIASEIEESSSTKDPHSSVSLLMTRLHEALPDVSLFCRQ